MRLKLLSSQLLDVGFTYHFRNAVAREPATHWKVIGELHEHRKCTTSNGGWNWWDLAILVSTEAYHAPLDEQSQYFGPILQLQKSEIDKVLLNLFRRN